jgi:hypothetical protein
MMMYTNAILDALDPEELEGVDPERVEERMVVAGWDAIEMLKGEA